MQRYQSHKQVHAEPMSLGAYNQYRDWTIPRDEDPSAPGYLVVYNRDTEDHYESWSPKHIFEDGYTPIEDGGGFAKLFHSEEHGQIMVTRGIDYDTDENIVSVTIELPDFGFAVANIRQTEGDMGEDTAKRVFSEVQHENAVQAAAAIAMAVQADE